MTRQQKGRMIALALPVAAALYAADNLYFGFTGFGYDHTVMTLLDDARRMQDEVLPEKRQQIKELKARSKQVDALKAQTAALQRMVEKLEAR